ncbi:unnamed protein product [Lymnaea stagnalis]|uniref:Uncharacterized protein n=1 Tax=Lymnaea stagnalis TaxID=6523 RepID=A0AAV2H1B1_LYMST
MKRKDKSNDSETDMSNNGDNCDSTPGPSKKPKSKTWYKQHFNSDWLQNPDFKDWLEPDPVDRFIVRCKQCAVTLKNANKTGLVKHMITKKHMRNFELKKEVTNTTEAIDPPKEPSLKEKVANAELLLTAFMSEYNIPFLQTDRLMDLFQKMFTDSAIAQSMNMKRTKASYLMQDGISREERNHIAEICRKTKFSLIIDEGSEIPVGQLLALVVRYYDETSCEVTDALLDCIEVKDATLEALYYTMKKLLEDKQIPLSNIIGYASDNCSAVTDLNSGLASFLMRDLPSVFTLGCICHSFTLCADHASQCLPLWLDTFIKNTCSYFTRTSKRQHVFQSLQEIANSQEHMSYKLSQTRWLSRGKVISCLLDQWDALLLFFQKEASAHKSDSAAEILTVMTTPGAKHSLLFVSYVLSKIARMDEEFQSENLRIHKVFASISDEYRNILDMFIKPEIMNAYHLADIDPTNATLHKQLEDIDVGGRCENLLLRQPLGDREPEYRHDFLMFLSHLCAEIKRRFPLSKDSVLAQVRAVGVEEALSTDVRLKSLIPLASSFPTLVAETDLDDLQDQWRLLPNSKDLLQNKDNLEPGVFWSMLRSTRDSNGLLKFELLARFMCSLMALPHSSARVESIFSQVNVVKTFQTNRLQGTTVTNRLLAMQAIGRKSDVGVSWTPPPSLIADVVEGRCHQRYKERVKDQQNRLSLIDLAEAGLMSQAVEILLPKAEAQSGEVQHSDLELEVEVAYI